MKAAKEGCCDSIKAHARNGCLLNHPGLNSAEIENSCTKSCKTASDHHGYNGISLLFHAAVFCSIFVHTCCAKLKTEFCFFQKYPHYDCHYHRNNKTDGYEFVSGKDLVQSTVGKKSTLIAAGKIYSVWSRLGFHLGKKQIHHIQGNPVQHDTGNNLVYIEVSLQCTGDAAYQGCDHDCCDHAYIPGHAKFQRKIQRSSGSNYILSCCSNVKKSNLVSKQNGQGTHQKCGSLYQCGSHILHHSLLAWIVKIILDNCSNRTRSSCRIDNKKYQITDEKTDHNA